MSEPNFQLSVENARIESSGDGDWLNYDVRNTGSNDVTDGALAVKYEALLGSSVEWSAEDIIGALPAGGAITVTQRLGDGLPDGHYFVWATLIDGSDASPGWATVDATVTGGRFAST